MAKAKVVELDGLVDFSGELTPPVDRKVQLVEVNLSFGNLLSLSLKGIIAFSFAVFLLSIIAAPILVFFGFGLGIIGH